VSNASVAGSIALRYRKGMDTILYSPETAGLPDIVSNPEIMFGTHCVIHRKTLTADAAFSGHEGPVYICVNSDLPMPGQVHFEKPQVMFTGATGYSGLLRVRCSC